MGLATLASREHRERQRTAKQDASNPLSSTNAVARQGGGFCDSTCGFELVISTS